jgi:cytochrome c peroxidase
MRCLPAARALALACLVAGPALGETFDLPLPAGLKPLRIPDDNPLTAAKVELGKQLYFDPRLSRDNTVSCASCHDPAKGWSNGERFATGIGGQVGGRSAPTIINAAYQRLQFWDGRADELEGQALGPIQNPIEMDLSIDELVEKLNAIPGYHRQFEAVFGTPATPDAIAKAIASFERTVLSGDAPFDRYEKGDKEALSPAARRGHEVFFHTAHCSACHQPPLFTDGAFHNIGVGIDDEKPDEGRHVISSLLGDRGAFKTPTLREIGRTAPYMHDGRFKTLEEVVEYYDKGGTPNDQLDESIFPLRLKPQDKADLIVFLKEGLASEKYPVVEPPDLPE